MSKFYVEITNKPYPAPRVHGAMVENVTRVWFNDYDSAAQYYATYELSSTERSKLVCPHDSGFAPLGPGPLAQAIRVECAIDRPIEPQFEPKAVDQRGIVFEPPLTPNHEPRFPVRRPAQWAHRYIEVDHPSKIGVHVFVKFGEKGFYEKLPRGGYSLCVDASTEESYLAGSMFGWDVPAALLAREHHNA